MFQIDVTKYTGKLIVFAHIIIRPINLKRLFQPSPDKHKGLGNIADTLIFFGVSQTSSNEVFWMYRSIDYQLGSTLYSEGCQLLSTARKIRIQ